MDLQQAQKAVRGIFMPLGLRVRVEFGGEMIADSSRAMLLRDSPVLLHYFFPREDVRMDLLQPSDHSTHSDWRGDTRHWTVEAGGQRAENAAWAFKSAPEGRPDTEGFLSFDWHSMDAWYVEDLQVFIHPRDPFSRIDTYPSSRAVRVELDGVTLAESNDVVMLFETGLPVRYYLSQQDVKMELLEPSDARTGCPYKGWASYWSIKVNGETYEDLVRSYQPGDVLPEVTPIEGRLAFYNEKVDHYVDGELQPRPRTRWSG